MSKYNDSVLSLKQYNTTYHDQLLMNCFILVCLVGGHSLDLGYYGIWLTSGRYASYLNAFLFVDKSRDLTLQKLTDSK